MTAKCSVTLAVTLMLAVGCLPPGARAGIIAWFAPVASGDGTLGNYPAAAQAELAAFQTWDLIVSYDTNDWAEAGVRLTFPGGAHFYKHPAGGLTRPNPALFPAFPALEFTTHFASPSDTGSATPSPTIVLGSFPESAHPASLGDASSPDPGVFHGSWGDTVVSPPGTYRIARWTFPLGVFPEIYDTPPMGSFTSLANGDFVVFSWPEPACLGLLAPFAPLVMRLRRVRAT